MSKQNKNSSILIRCVFIVIILALIGGAGMFALAKHRQSSAFEAKRSVIISHTIKEEKDSNSDQFNSSDLSMMPTYKNIAENETVAQAARTYLPHKLRKQYSANDLSGLVDAHVSQQSLVLNLSVTTANKNDSVKLVNATARGLKKELPSLQPGAGTVRLLAPATKNSTVNVSSHHTKKYVVVGLAFGALLGLIVSFFYVTWLKLL